MSKELVVSANRHETRVALLDDDKLVEVSIERIAEHALAGSVYKGRVNRVLPGMQSAFVKVGLDRDAFLYVSDVIDETADLEDGVLDDPEDALVAGGSSSRAEDSAEPERKSRSRGDRPDRKSEQESGSERPSGRERRGRRSRRRRSRKDDSLLPESKFAAVDEVSSKRSKSDKPDPKPQEKPEVGDEEDDDYGLTLLPGESLAKYSGASKSVSEDEDDEEPLATGATHLEDVGEKSDGDDSDDDIDPADDSDDYGEDSENSEQSDDDEDDSENGSEEDGDDDVDDDDESDDSEDDDAGDDESDDEESDDDDDSDDDSGDDDSHDESDDDDEDEDSGKDEPENPDQEIEEDSGSDEETDEDNPSGLPARRLFEPGTDPEKLEASGEAGGDGPTEAAVRDSRGERQLRRGRRGRRRGRRRGGRGDSERTRESQDAKPETAEAKTDGSHGQPGDPEPANGAENDERSSKGEGQDRDDRSEKSERSGRSGRSDRSDRGAGNESDVRISDLLKAGQEIIVQIAKEPLGKKGARITTHIALPGRHLVYMPTSPHVGVSRKIGSDAERARLRKVIKANMEGIPGGFIVRTAGAGASDEDLADDMRFLANLWKTIQEKADRAPAPLLLHQDLDVVERILRDQLGQNFESIWVDSEEHYESIVRFVERFQPDLVGKVKLYTRTKPIFDEFNITQELEKALRPKVWLKSGGYLVINQTEALVAIDINTGKYVGKSDRLEDTIAKTNLEAVQEIVRQMRLRDLGGIIVVDFIDMDDKSNRKKVLQSLEKELRRDRAPSKVLQFNDFGLVAITRKRVKQSLERSLCSPCPACEGSGFVKSTTSVILDILEQARRMAPKLKGKKDLTLRVNPDVARALKARGNTYLPELEEVFGAHVLVRSDVSLHRENFDVN